jgi:Ca2+-binding RTX toxin-like protein
LIGTTGIDTIHARNGDDLLATGGGRDSIYGEAGNDLISGFHFNLDNLGASASRGAFVDGGTGTDTLILDVDPARTVSVLARAASAMTIHNVEVNIYNVGAISAKQVIVGTKQRETICTSGNASVRGMEGDDYIFTQDGDDKLDGGTGNDYLSAGAGHNVLTGGRGADDFAFHFQDQYQYSEITDFNVKQDKIAIILTSEQLGVYSGRAPPEFAPKHSYGNGIPTPTGEINQYISYNNGRYFDRDDFYAGDDSFLSDFVTYEKATGSVLLNHFERDSQFQLHSTPILLAHIDGNKALHADDFVFFAM